MEAYRFCFCFTERTSLLFFKLILTNLLDDLGYKFFFGRITGW